MEKDLKKNPPGINDTQTAGGQGAPPPPPGHQNYGQYGAPLPPYMQKKKSGKGKWILLIIGIIVIIAIANAATGDEEKTSEGTVVRGESAGEPGAAGDNAAVGETLAVDDLEVTVYSWDSSAGDGFSTPAGDNQYIVVDVGITNNGDESKSISTIMEMSLRTPEGYKYTLAPYFPDPQYPDGSIMPGSVARGNVAFEVPGQIGEIYFVFEPLSLINTKLLKFRLQ